MKIIFKITRHNPEEKVISVKICRLHSHKSIDEYKSKRVDYSEFDMFNTETFIDSVVRKCGHRIQGQDEKEDILPSNQAEDFPSELNVDELLGKVISGKLNLNYKGILKMRRVNL